MSPMHYKGYAARIEYSDEDGCFVGRVAGIRDMITFHGESVDELRAAFHEAVDFYLATCAQRGETPQKPYSGRLMVRIAPELHARAAMLAEATGKSLRQTFSLAQHTISPDTGVEEEVRYCRCGQFTSHDGLAAALRKLFEVVQVASAAAGLFVGLEIGETDEVQRQAIVGKCLPVRPCGAIA